MTILKPQIKKVSAENFQEKTINEYRISYLPATHVVYPWLKVNAAGGAVGLFISCDFAIWSPKITLETASLVPSLKLDTIFLLLEGLSVVL